MDAVKCKECNIIINEVLAYLQNKLEVLTEDQIVRICSTGFSAEDIEKAKILLFSSVTSSSTSRRVRKGSGKHVRDVEDMIAFFKGNDPELFPIFVARDLNKLPPVSYDHIDVTKLVKDIQILKAEISYIKESYVTTEEVNNRVQELKKQICAPTNFLDVSVSKKIGGYLLDSGPTALSYNEQYECSNNEPSAPTIQTHSNTEAATMVPVLSNIASRGAKPTRVSPPPPMRSPPVSTVVGANAKECTLPNVNKPSMAEMVRNEREWKIDRPADEWIMVQRKRYRNRFIGQKGKASVQSTEKFKAADIKVPLFISNVHKDSAETDIINYIREKTNEIVSLQKIDMKQDKGYNSYKLLVSKHRVNTFLDDNLWPDGISFRRFVYLRNKREK